MSEIQNNIFEEIKNLVSKKGYFYAMCLILKKDFLISMEEVRDANHQVMFNSKEISLFLGLMINNEFNLDLPSEEVIEEYFSESYRLKNKLHQNFWLRQQQGNYFVEPIFYSGSGAYDMQFVDLMEEKYKYDSSWLATKKGVDIGKLIKIAKRIKEIFKSRINTNVIRQKPHNNTELAIGLTSLMDFFIVKESDFDKELDVNIFFDNFSIIPGNNINQKFDRVGAFNWFSSKPIINIGPDKYFIPMCTILYESMYESPYYWMVEDKSYIDSLGKNRGQAGEEIAYKYLSAVFGEGNIFKSVNVVSRKNGNTITDIDVLCLLGSYALCVQVKSKKLTMSSRMGDELQLIKDFKAAVQDAYGQGIVSRNSLLGNEALFLNEQRGELNFKHKIETVFILVLIMENYPALVHQAHVFLQQPNGEQLPLAMTVFDLELVSYYLRDSHDFMYYIKQRINLIRDIFANEEVVFLGYHFEYNLWKHPENAIKILDPDHGQIIDQDYCKHNTLDFKDTPTPRRWMRGGTGELFRCIRSINSLMAEKISFLLMDFEHSSIDDLVSMIKKWKLDSRPREFSFLPEVNNTLAVGFSFVLRESNLTDLENTLKQLCQTRMYISRVDIWIGFGSLITSNNLIDIALYFDKKWKRDYELERLFKMVLNDKPKTSTKFEGAKIGRNDPCPCGSGLKYKRCCS